MAQAWDQALGIGRVNRPARPHPPRARGRPARPARLLRWPMARAAAHRGAHARLAAAAGVTVFGSLLATRPAPGTVSAAFRRQEPAGATFAKALRVATAPRDASADVTRRLTERIATSTSSMLRYADLTVPHGAWLTTRTTGSLEGRPIVGIEIGTAPPIDLPRLGRCESEASWSSGFRARAQPGGGRALRWQHRRGDAALGERRRRPSSCAIPSSLRTA